MRKTVAAALFVLLSLTSAFAADWTLLADKLSRATVYIEHEGGACSGVVINDSVGDKGEFDYILTAAHCDGKEIYADQARAVVMTKDQKVDVMVLRVPDTERPAIKLAKADPKQGEEVAAFGYGYALEQPMLRVTHISIAEADIPSLSGKYVVTDATFVPGMSGGGVVNAAGELVMMVQMGSNSVGIGKGAEAIKGKVGKYFGDGTRRGSTPPEK
jgi:S1-C subfamily serine protease